MTAHATPSALVKTLLLGSTLALGVFGVSAQADAQQTFCQKNGHGAAGCPMWDGTTGHCWANANSNTGYVCKEDAPPKEAQSALEPVEPDPSGEEAELLEELDQQQQQLGF